MIIIGIAGGSGSGKTTVVKKVMNSFANEDVGVLSQDSYYRDLKHLSEKDRSLINFDHPESIEFELLVDHLKELRKGNGIGQPTYDYIQSLRLPLTLTIEPSPIVIVEGILLFTDKRVRNLCDIKIFVDAEPDERLIRIVKRDMRDRGRNANEVIERYALVKEMHVHFIEPTKRFADLIIPQGGENHVAIDMLVAAIRHFAITKRLAEPQQTKVLHC